MIQKKKYTIKDIAAISKVSVSTVSRVLNNADDVNEKTRANILEVIKTLNYNPNPAAKALVNRSSKYVAVIVPNIHHSGVSKIVQGIMKELSAHEFEVLLFDYHYGESHSMEKRYFSFLDKKLIDGLIMIASIAEDWEILEMAKKIPTTLIERTIMDSDIDSVISDERCGMEQLIGYLVLNGHTKIGFINGEKGTSSADRRLKAFKVSMESAGLEYIEERVFHAKWSLNGGKETFIRMMENKCDVTAVICASDQMALGALGAAYKLGMSVPKDISIVGFDNFDEGEVSVPPLTTLKYPAFDIGVHAARCLIDRIGNNGKMAENYILPISLLERDSVLKI